MKVIFNLQRHRSLLLRLTCCLLPIACCLNANAQTLTLDEIWNLANNPTIGITDSITKFLTRKGWEHYPMDTTMTKDGKQIAEYNTKWTYQAKNDSLGLCWFFYKKKLNTVTLSKGYFENIQYSIACRECFRDIRDSVLATGWPMVQDDRSDEKTLQTYNAGDFSIMLVRHFRGDTEWYDILIIRKKPVE